MDPTSGEPLPPPSSHPATVTDTTAPPSPPTTPTTPTPTTTTPNTTTTTTTATTTTTTTTATTTNLTPTTATSTNIPTSTETHTRTSSGFTQSTISYPTSTSTSTTTIPFVPPANDLPNYDSGGLSSGAIAGIVVGSVVALFAIASILFLAWKRHKHRQADFDSSDMFKPVSMSQYNPSSHDDDSIGAHARPSKDAIGSFAGRSNDLAHHPDNILTSAALGAGMYGYETEGDQGGRPYLLYPAHPDQEGPYQQQYHPFGYQADHDWHDRAAGYYGAEHGHHDGYEGYYDDPQIHQAGSGHEYEAGGISGPISSGLSSNRTSPPVKHATSNIPQYSTDGTRDPFSSTTGTDTVAGQSSTAGSRTELGSSGDELLSTPTVTSSHPQGRSPQLNPELKRAPQGMYYKE